MEKSKKTQRKDKINKKQGRGEGQWSNTENVKDQKNREKLKHKTIAREQLKDED